MILFVNGIQIPLLVMYLPRSFRPLSEKIQCTGIPVQDWPHCHLHKLHQYSDGKVTFHVYCLRKPQFKNYLNNIVLIAEERLPCIFLVPLMENVFFRLSPVTIFS